MNPRKYFYQAKFERKMKREKIFSDDFGKFSFPANAHINDSMSQAQISCFTFIFIFFLSFVFYFINFKLLIVIIHSQQNENLNFHRNFRILYSINVTFDLRHSMRTEQFHSSRGCEKVTNFRESTEFSHIVKFRLFI